MWSSSEGSIRDRILLLTPTGRDAALITDFLSRAGLSAHACAAAGALAKQIEAGGGVAIIAEEALTPCAVEALSACLKAQPAWSDLPIIMLSIAGESTPAIEHKLSELNLLGNLTVVERPVRPATLISIVNTALRARHRQYEVNSLLDDLHCTEERLRTMIESAQDYAIVNIDLHGRVTYWNAGAERLLGYPEQTILGCPIEIVFSEEDRRGGLPARELAAARITGRAESEGWRVRRDGSHFWASGVVTPTRNPAGTVTGYVKVLRDMTEHKRAEDRLAEQAEALRQSNEDLQRFAYAASHDLQEPLRTIGSYSQLLARKNGSRLDEDSQQFVKYIVSGVDRMRTLIGDLLDFSRLTSQQPRPPGPVDCNAILGLTLQQLQLRISETGAKVTFDRLPVVLSHENRLMQVFQNVIANALRYCQGIPEIHVSAEREADDRWRIAIRDNGIGIAPEYHTRIFGLFERLHSRAEYAGTGIGLATCKRIIEQNGGRIWVESAVGEGSTFYFTVPAVDATRSSHAQASTAD